MAQEDNSILDEINEELKHDQVMAFFKKHKDAIAVMMAAAVIGIIAYSSWHERKNKKRQEITAAMVEMMRFSGAQQNDKMIATLMENAPSEIKPILNIMLLGDRILYNQQARENARKLLELSQKNGVDIIWRDLAIIIYASHRQNFSSELVKLLEPLCAKDRPFRFTAIEIIASIHNDNGNSQKALELLKKITDAKDAPYSMRQRIEIIINYIKNSMREKL